MHSIKIAEKETMIFEEQGEEYGRVWREKMKGTNVVQ